MQLRCRNAQSFNVTHTANIRESNAETNGHVPDMATYHQDRPLLSIYSLLQHKPAWCRLWHRTRRPLRPAVCSTFYFVTLSAYSVLFLLLRCSCFHKCQFTVDHAHDAWCVRERGDDRECGALLSWCRRAHISFTVLSFLLFCLLRTRHHNTPYPYVVSSLLLGTSCLVASDSLWACDSLFLIRLGAWAAS